MTDVPPADPAQRRRFALLLLALAVGLALVVLVLVLLNHQWWMFALLVLVVPNVYIGLRELRAARSE